MPLSWNEIRSRALSFSREWADESSENAEAKTFWNEFFHIFGISRRRVASFEQKVKKIGDKDGYIDLLWKGILLIEHKSRGKDLDRAHKQALDYFPGLKERELPRYIIVSDFAHFRLYDLEEDTQHQFAIEDLHKNVDLFAFIAGYQTHKIEEQDPVNIKAAERMGKLHDKLKEIGYEGHPLEVYLVRLLFCMFAEDTGIFERQQFQDYIELHTREDGSDLADRLSTLFHVLNTPHDKRLTNRDESLNAFPYINGKLFNDYLPPAAFDSEMREGLLQCCALNWSQISPAIFGSLFQSIMDKEARRNLGAHYTSEENILKLIKPLFLDDLYAEFEKIKPNKKKLHEFHLKLRTLNFLDPACGCGNFLVIAYRELRLLELEVLRASRDPNQPVLDVSELILLDVDQFYGIEIEEFPSQIAQVALWLMDHQMNLLVSEKFGQYFARIPLRSSANVVHGNALRLDWNEVIPAERLSYILGNPPFVGKKEQTQTQKEDFKYVFSKVKGFGVLDFVCAWYLLAAKYIQNNAIDCAFVSTNSISHGEQISILWKELYDLKVTINFAHRTFNWKNEAKGQAAVHCVIIGFSKSNKIKKYIYDYENVKGEPQLIEARRINPYLVNAPEVLIEKRRTALNIDAPKITYGSMPIDNGNLTIKTQEIYDAVISQEPEIQPYIRPYFGGDELINNLKRYCIWLKGIEPSIIKKSKFLYQRTQANREYRLSSSREATNRLASKASLFGEIRQPENKYLLIPKVSSERRKHIPMDFLSPNIIASGSSLIVPDANMFHFGILTSEMHMSWVRAVCGRMKSDYQYSNSIVYNNFPWPENPSDKQVKAIEDAAQAVLDARAQFPDSSLADLYDPLTMPPVLLKAHQTLDKTVDAAYGKRSFATEADRVAFLFELYQEYVAKSQHD
jgi:hypothetical protein